MSKKIALHTGLEKTTDELLKILDYRISVNETLVNKVSLQEILGCDSEVIIRNLISRIKELEDENEEFLKRLSWSYG